MGWDACELLAKSGAPYDTDLQASSRGKSARWWYRDPLNTSDLRLVTLYVEGARWKVGYVSGW